MSFHLTILFFYFCQPPFKFYSFKFLSISFSLCAFLKELQLIYILKFLCPRFLSKTTECLAISRNLEQAHKISAHPTYTETLQM